HTVAVHLNLGANVGVPHAGGVSALQLWVSPSPVTTVANVRFVMPRAGHASVQIFDIAGRRVATLGDGDYASGSHVLSWSGNVEAGRAPAGIYRVRLATDHGTRSLNLVLLR